MSNCMPCRLVCLILVAAAFICQSAISQTVTEAEQQVRSYEIQRGWALQFGIAGDFTLTSFDGTALSIKRNYSDRNALRIGFSVSGYTTESDITESLGPDEKNKNNYSDISLGVAVHLIKYLKADGRVKCFYGLGPRFEYSHGKEEIEINDREAKDNSVALGFSALLGGEWFVARNLSLSAEYGATIAYQHMTEKRISSVSQDEPRVTEISTDGFTVFPNNIKFGLSLYF